MKLITYRLFGVLSVILPIVFASGVNAGQKAALSDADKAAATEIAGKVPGIESKNVRPSSIPGLYEVIIAPQVLYISRDAKLLFYGDIVDRKTGENLTTPIRDKARLAIINEIDESSMIIFSPKKETKHTITVFTDIDCGYCRKLHSEINTYTDLGIKVRYLSYPRAGLNSPSYEKAVNVWCAKDRKKAITIAKLNQKVTSEKCDAPVKSHMLLGEKLGVNGTPNLILDDGRMVPGYVPAPKLLEILNKK
ncbi:MAG: thioredoxin fold domain-containing protein [Thiohalomonadales bacterium]